MPYLVLGGLTVRFLRGLLAAAAGAVVLLFSRQVFPQSLIAPDIPYELSLEPGVALAAILFLAAAYWLASESLRSPRASEVGALRLWWLVSRSLSLKAFRSLAMGMGVGVVIGALFLSSILGAGATSSVNLARGALGADLIVVPPDTEVQAQPLFVYPFTFTSSLSADVESRIRSLPGVKATAGQLVAGEVAPGGGCGVVNRMFIVGFNPERDFMVTAILGRALTPPLEVGEIVKGISTPGPETVYTLQYYGGLQFKVRETLPETGTFVDHTWFMSMDTLERMARVKNPAAPLQFEKGRINVIYVKLDEAASVDEVANAIRSGVEGVRVIKATTLAEEADKRLTSIALSLYSVGGATLGVSFILVAVFASTVVGEKRREIGLLRAVGASNAFVLKLVMAEVGLVTLIGGAVGVAGAWLLFSLGYVHIIGALRIPYLSPPFADVALAVAFSLGVAAAVGLLGALYPAMKSSRLEPYEAIRQGSR